MRLARFADLAHADPDWLDPAARAVAAWSPRWPTLPQEQINKLNHVCAQEMRRLYGSSC
jgi:endo-alpha-1,4-polygalactosaminidase (GH114 family)